MRKWICISLAVVCIMSCCMSASAAGAGYFNFEKNREYAPGMFSDVEAGSDEEIFIAAAFELGFLSGNEDGTFAPKAELSLAESIKIAAEIHKLYNGGSADFPAGEIWYQPYVDYALSREIISAPPDNPDSAATKGEFAALMAKAMPESAFPQINGFADDEIRDVKPGDEYADEIYMFYRAGVLHGSADTSRYKPNKEITRYEAAEMISRMVYRSLRLKFSITQYLGPDLVEKEAADDEFFANAAILGNSLAEGIRIYTGLDTMRYYSATSLTIYTAGSYLDQMALYDYDKVYINLGINEVGTGREAFKEQYGKLIDRIAADQPNADIYLMAIMPVTYAKASGGVFTLERLNTLNGVIYELAQEKSCYYVDNFNLFADESGYMPVGKTWDGVHLEVAEYAVWENYLRTHYVD